MTLRGEGDGPRGAVGKERYEGGRADRAAVGKEEGGGDVGVEAGPQRAVRDAGGFGEDAPGVGDDLTLKAAPDAVDASGRDAEQDVPEAEGGRVPNDASALPDRSHPSS